MADGVTLKKVTMKSLDDMITFEYQRQAEYKKTISAISGQCAEYGMTDQPYIRMLKDMTLVEVLDQIKADYAFEKQKEEVRLAQERAEQGREEILAQQQKEHPEFRTILGCHIDEETQEFDPETGEILDGGQLSQNQQEAVRGAGNGLKRYTQKMTLEVYFADTKEKDYFKNSLADLGFEHKKNYTVQGYQRIEPLTQAELDELIK